MSGLKSFKFTTLPTGQESAEVKRRRKLIDRLNDQKRLVEDASYRRTIKRWTKKDGERTLVEKHHKVHPWFRTDEKGNVVFFVRVGFKPLEFEKGKSGIVVGAKDQLGTVIDTLIAATAAGELDDLIGQAMKAAKPAAGRQRKAA